MSESDRAVLDAILAGKTPPVVPSRREFPRFCATYPVLLEPEGGAGAAVAGTTVNVCRTGMLVTLDAPVAAGTRCQIGFIPTHRYRPELVECPRCGGEFPILELPDEPIRGTVVRVERPGDRIAAAILFDDPLPSMN